MRWIIVLLLVVSGTAGCGGGETPKPESPEKATPAAAKIPDHPAAHAAHQFFTAMSKGDEQAANKLLTPTARRQFEATQQRFVPEEGTGSQLVIEKLEPAGDDHMMVKCVGKIGDAEGQMCCWMRLVEGQWLVRGIIGEAPDSTLVAFDFEGASPMTPIDLGGGQTGPANSAPQAPQSAMAPGGNPVQ